MRHPLVFAGVVLAAPLLVAYPTSAETASSQTTDAVAAEANDDDQLAAGFGAAAPAPGACAITSGDGPPVCAGDCPAGEACSFVPGYCCSQAECFNRTCQGSRDCGPEETCSAACTCITATSPCDLALMQYAGSSITGQPLVFLTVVNVGSQPCPGDTVVTDDQPEGLIFAAPVTANQSGWSCALAESSNNLSCTASAELAAGFRNGVTITLPVTVTVEPGRSVENCATVTNGADANAGNNSACVAIEAPPNPAPTATPTPPQTTSGCPGDCDGTGEVGVNEIILTVNIALGSLPLSACVAADANHDGSVRISEIIAAVNSTLDGCPCGFTGARMCGGACPNAADTCRPLPDDSGCVCAPPGPIPTATETATPTVTPTPGLVLLPVLCGAGDGFFSAECCDHNCYLCAIFSDHACCQDYADICDWVIFG